VAALREPEKPRSQDARAVVPIGAFRAAGVDPRAFERLCTPIAGDRIEIKISPGALAALAKRGAAEQDSLVARAVPFADANFGRAPTGRSRVWDTDLAMAEGEKTEADVRAWRVLHGLDTSRPTGGMRRP